MAGALDNLTEVEVVDCTSLTVLSSDVVVTEARMEVMEMTETEGGLVILRSLVLATKNLLQILYKLMSQKILDSQFLHFFLKIFNDFSFCLV